MASVFKNQRHSPRITLSIPIQLIFGSQINLQGQIRDLSLKSAFVLVRSSIHMASNDELDFIIDGHADNPMGVIHGSARISRVVPGEGIAIFFIKIDEPSLSRLSRLVGSRS